MSDLVYLYGFVPIGTSLPEGGLTGVAGRPVQLLPLLEASAAVSEVPAALYAPDTLEPRLQDLAWVAAQAVEHERVVAWFVDHAQILPVRLFTIYADLAELVREAEARSRRIAAFLARFAGLREWDLKVSFRAEELGRQIGQLSPEIAELDRELESAAPGRRYLLEKKRADLLRVEVGRNARRLAAELLDDLRDKAVRVETASPAVEGAELPVAVNAALLLPTEQENSVRDEVMRRIPELNALGLEVAYSGPWAPYRFIEEDDGGT